MRITKSCLITNGLTLCSSGNNCATSCPLIESKREQQPEESKFTRLIPLDEGAAGEKGPPESSLHLRNTVTLNFDHFDKPAAIDDADGFELVDQAEVVARPRSLTQRFKDKTKRLKEKLRRSKSKKRDKESKKQPDGGDGEVDGGIHDEARGAGVAVVGPNGPVGSPAAESTGFVNVKLGSGPEYVCDVEELDPGDIQRLELLENVGGLLNQSDQHPAATPASILKKQSEKSEHLGRAVATLTGIPVHGQTSGS